VQVKDAPSLDAGLATYNAMIELDPASPGIYSQIASLYSGREQFRKALEYLQKSLEFCPTCGNIYERIADAYKNLQDKEQALTQLQKIPDSFTLSTLMYARSFAILKAGNPCFPCCRCIILTVS
jgi:tetratricopeptide (TPR) repeat protein